MAQQQQQQAIEAQRYAEQWQNQLQQQAETIRQYETTLAETKRQFDVAQGLEREKLAQEMRRLELQLAFDREQLAENRRQYDLTFGEGQRQFDIGTGQNYLRTAVDVYGQDPARQAAYLLGDKGGITPIEGALKAFKPLGSPVTPAARGTKGAGKGYLVGEGNDMRGVDAGVAEVVNVDAKGKLRGIIPIAGRMAAGMPYHPSPMPRPDWGSLPQYPIGVPPRVLPPKVPGGRYPLPPKGTYPSVPSPDRGYTMSAAAAAPVSPYEPESDFWREMTEDQYRIVYGDYERRQQDPNAYQYTAPGYQATTFNTPQGLPGFGFQRPDQEQFWKDVLLRADARLTQDPKDATAIAAKNNALRYQATIQTRDTLLRAFYGNIPPAAGSLAGPAQGFAPDAAQEYASAQASGIDPAYGIPLASPESQAGRFYSLPPATQAYLASFYGIRNLGGGEFQRRMKVVTPQGLRSGARFGYG
jgi:hypothetical protein